MELCFLFKQIEQFVGCSLVPVHIKSIYYVYMYNTYVYYQVIINRLKISSKKGCFFSQEGAQKCLRMTRVVFAAKHS